jgi:hypothetical protein
MLDVRLPIGGLFIILGILISSWGYFNPTVLTLATIHGPLPINWDIMWGIFMTIFGLFMFSFARYSQASEMEKKLQQEKAQATTTSPSGEAPTPTASEADSKPASDVASKPSSEADSGSKSEEKSSPEAKPE